METETQLCPCSPAWYETNRLDPDHVPRMACPPCVEAHGPTGPHGRWWSDYCADHDYLPPLSAPTARERLAAALADHDGEAAVGHGEPLDDATRAALWHQAEVVDGLRDTIPWRGLVSPERTDSLVYFLMRGEYIKIGRTVDLDRRLSNFQQTRSDVLATVPGGRLVETEWHRRFAHLRDRDVYGGKEWFRATDELLSAIAAVA